MVIDRRKGVERRSVRRHDVTIDITWDGKSGEEKGVLADISERGCFVLGSGDVEDGDVISIYVPMPNGLRVQFSGEIVNHVLEIGFGLRFLGLNSAQEELLQQLIDSAIGEG